MGGSSHRPPTAQRAYRARAGGSSRCSLRSSHPESVTQARAPRHWPPSRTQAPTQRWEAHLRPGSPSDRPSLALALADSVASLARTRAPTPRLFIATIDCGATPQFSGNALRGGEHMADSTSPNDFPLESAIPATSLDSILCTEELRHRPWRPPDYEKENGALGALLSALLHSPHDTLQILAETILDVTQCDSSGLSLLTKDPRS